MQCFKEKIPVGLPGSGALYTAFCLELRVRADWGKSVLCSGLDNTFLVGGMHAQSSESTPDYHGAVDWSGSAVCMWLGV